MESGGRSKLSTDPVHEFVDNGIEAFHCPHDSYLSSACLKSRRTYCMSSRYKYLLNASGPRITQISLQKCSAMRPHFRNHGRRSHCYGLQCVIRATTGELVVTGGRDKIERE